MVYNRQPYPYEVLLTVTNHSSNSGHPLRLSTTSNGTHGGGSEHSADPNVTINGVAGQAGAYTEINLEGYMSLWLVHSFTIVGSLRYVGKSTYY